MVITYTLLALAVLLLWARGACDAGMLRRRAWLVAFVASLVAAGLAGIVKPLGLVWIVAFAGAVTGFVQAEGRTGWRVLSGVGVLVLSVGLMAHVLPGFANPRVLSAVRLGADTVPYSLHLNYDKTLIGLFILGCCHPRIASLREWRTVLATTAPIAVLTILAVLVLSLAIGYVRFDPKVPAWTALWLGVNLAFTCVAEEALFRGFIQAQLQRWWGGEASPTGGAVDPVGARTGATVALVVAAVLFGLAHFAGGVGYVLLATVAGLGYGWVYHRTRRVEASILTHFALNTVHFLGFSYPALAKAVG